MQRQMEKKRKNMESTDSQENDLKPTDLILSLEEAKIIYETLCHDSFGQHDLGLEFRKILGRISKFIDDAEK